MLATALTNLQIITVNANSKAQLKPVTFNEVHPLRESKQTSTNVKDVQGLKEMANTVASK